MYCMDCHEIVFMSVKKRMIPNQMLLTYQIFKNVVTKNVLIVFKVYTFLSLGVLSDILKDHNELSLWLHYCNSMFDVITVVQC